MVSRFRTDQSHGSRWGRRQFGETHQVVAGDGHFRPQPVAGNPAVAQFPSATHRLHPAEDLFNPFPCPLAEPVTIVASGGLSMAERCFWATWGVTFRFRHSLTKPLVS